MGACLAKPKVDGGQNSQPADSSDGQLQTKRIPANHSDQNSGTQDSKKVTTEVGSAGAGAEASMSQGSAADAKSPPPPGTPSHESSRLSRPPTLDEAGAALTESLSPLEESPPYIPPPPALSLRPKGGPGDDWEPARRKAVVIGLNAWGTSSTLVACAETAQAVVSALRQTYSFNADEIIFLHDAQPEQASLPSKENIMRAVSWLLEGARAGDALFFCFVGAGLLGCDGWSADHQLNSIQGYAATDETSDLTNSLRQLLMNPLPAGVRLHVLLDTVSAISPVDLPHVAEFRPDGWAHWKGEPEYDSISEEEDEFSSENEESHGDRKGGVSGFSGAQQSSADVLPRGKDSQGDLLPTAGEVIILKGAPKFPGVGQSMESFIARPRVGAIAFALVQALEQGHSETYDTLLRAMRYAVKNGPSHYIHVPEMHCSHRISLGRPFLL